MHAKNYQNIHWFDKVIAKIKWCSFTAVLPAERHSSWAACCNHHFCFRQLGQLASCIIYARALLEYVIIIMWLPSVIKMLRSAKFAEDKVLTFFILRDKC